MPIIPTLANLQEEHSETMESWFAAKREKFAPMLTTSVDMRHSGFKLAPVDANVYPAGFQNLSENACSRAASQFKAAIEYRAPGAKKILIFPEAHTRNLPYLDNLISLRSILETAGFEVVVGSMINNEGQPLELTSALGQQVTQHPLVKTNGKLHTQNGFEPDFILLNNDCTAGVPALLKEITQPVSPTPCMGWFQRKKSDHFAAYEQLATHFALQFGIDPWQISAYFERASGVNFKARLGADELAQKVDALIQKIKHKYDEYGISDTPYVYVKADSGTYGMGIMLVHDGSELLELNKKQRNKMHVIKEGAEVHDVLLQEGVPTIDFMDGDPAEPMIYMVDGMPVGGMFRVNSGRDALGNLNATGMAYAGMCDEDEDSELAHKVSGCDFSAYGMVAAISALAVGSEREALRAQKESGKVACGS